MLRSRKEDEARSHILGRCAVKDCTPWPDHPIRQGVQIRKGEFLSEISVPIPRKRDTGKMSAPVALKRKPKLLPPSRYQPEPPSTNLIELARTESKYRGTGLSSTGPPKSP